MRLYGTNQEPQPTGSESWLYEQTYNDYRLYNILTHTHRKQVNVYNLEKASNLTVYFLFFLFFSANLERVLTFYPISGVKITCKNFSGYQLIQFHILPAPGVVCALFTVFICIHDSLLSSLALLVNDFKLVRHGIMMMKIPLVCGQIRKS